MKGLLGMLLIMMLVFLGSMLSCNCLMKGAVWWAT